MGHGYRYTHTEWTRPWQPYSQIIVHDYRQTIDRQVFEWGLWIWKSSVLGPTQCSLLVWKRASPQYKETSIIQDNIQSQGKWDTAFGGGIGRQFQRSFNGGWWQKSRNSWFQKKRTFQEKSHPWSQLAAPFLLGRTKKMSCCRGERPYSMLPVDKSCFPYTLPPSLWVQLFLCCYLLFLSSCSISLVTPSPHWGLCVLSGPGHSFPSFPSFLPTILW